jgi:hypothetical protein
MKKNNKIRIVETNSNSPETTSKEAQMSYEYSFLQKEPFQQRGNKSIYVKPEHHQRLTRIAQVIGDDKIPLFAYLNNILEHHFTMFEDEITEEFKQKFKPLY